MDHISIVLFALGVIVGVFIAYLVEAINTPAAQREVEKADDGWETESSDEDDQLTSDLSAIEVPGYNEVMKEKYPLDDMKMVFCV